MGFNDQPDSLVFRAYRAFHTKARFTCAEVADCFRVTPKEASRIIDNNIRCGRFKRIPDTKPQAYRARGIV